MSGEYKSMNEVSSINATIARAMIVLVVVSWVLSAPGLAQQLGRNPGPCPSGAAPVNGSCGSPSNNASMPDANRSVVWRSRYGAIAATEDKSIIGVSSDQSSMRAAKKMALKKCAEKDCRVLNGYSNSCVAVASGKKQGHGVLAFSDGATEVDAEESVLMLCEDSGGIECKVSYAGCSFPVRVK